MLDNSVEYCDHEQGGRLSETAARVTWRFWSLMASLVLHGWFLVTHEYSWSVVFSLSYAMAERQVECLPGLVSCVVMRAGDRAVLFEQASTPAGFVERGCEFDKGKVKEAPCCRWFVLAESLVLVAC